MQNTNKVISFSADGAFRMLSKRHPEKFIIGFRSVGEDYVKIIELELVDPESLYEYGRQLMGIFFDTKQKAKALYETLDEEGLSVCLVYAGSILYTNYDMEDDPLYTFREDYELEIEEQSQSIKGEEL